MTEKDEPQVFKKRYKVVKKLGAGNFGTAYLVTDLKAKNEAKVLKVVRLGEMDPDQSVASVQEAELLSNLHNEHIVKFYESFLENDCLCIVTELCEGGDLDQRFKELKKQSVLLEEDQIVEWLIQILIAAQYMHKSRILHRDLKARNIFLKSNKVKIGDFGISRILVGTMDVANTFTGTPYYMSPEVMKHDGYESKSDIWSVGCLLYEMCTYQHAFDGKGLMNVIYKVVEGQTPELPKTYSKELNDLSKKMFAKDPKQRPSAAELLQTSFLLGHRQRIQMNGPLENTISANRRLKDINTRLQSPMNFGEMQKQSWSLSSQDQTVVENENDDDGDDDEDVELGHNTFYKRNIKNIEEEEEQQTLKANNTQKTAKQTMIERKLHEAEARAQALTQAMQSNTLGAAHNRQIMHERTINGSMKQTWPSFTDVEIKEQTSNSRTYNPNQFSNERTYNVRTSPDNFSSVNKLVQSHSDDRPIATMRETYTGRTNPDQFGSFNKLAQSHTDDRPIATMRETYGGRTNPDQFSNKPVQSRNDDRPIPKMRETYTGRANPDQFSNFNKPTRSRTDDRPITPMRATYRQIADKFGDEDGLPIDPSLTNQYYEAYNDFEKEDDYSPTREKHEREFHDQVCRSFNGRETALQNERSMSASQRSTINSMSRTIDSRYAANAIRQSKYVTSSRTIASATKKGTLPNSTSDDNNTTLKDNPKNDAFGPLAKDKKITSLRAKAIEKLGEASFEKVHDYLIKQRSAQRTDPMLDDGQITEGLTAFVKKPSDCFLVDQLVFLELV